MGLIDRLTRGRALVVGMTGMSAGMILAALTPVLPYTGGLAIVAVVCVLCLTAIAWGLRRPLPVPAPDLAADEAVEPEVAAVAAS